MGDRYRDEIALQRRNHKGHKGAEQPATVRTTEQERNALRSAYFAKKAKGHRSPPAWRVLDA